jgi:hypothetical protein
MSEVKKLELEGRGGSTDKGLGWARRKGEVRIHRLCLGTKEQSIWDRGCNSSSSSNSVCVCVCVCVC